MNPRLLAYLRSLGMAANAEDSAAWEFFSGLRGVQRSIANALNYVEEDVQARTTCDVAIRALGYDPTSPGTLLRAEPDAPVAPVAQPEDAVRSERARAQSIANVGETAGVAAEMVQRAIAEGWTVDRASTEFAADFRTRNRANVPPDGAPAGHAVNNAVTRDVLEAGLLHLRGVDPTQHWSRVEHNQSIPVALGDAQQRAIESSYRLRSASLEDFIRMAAQVDGIRNLPMGRDGLLQAYQEQYSRAMSTSTLVGMFTTNINSELLAAFSAFPDSTMGGWVREADNADFRSNDRVRLEAGGALKKLSRGGEADADSLTDATESYKVSRYAKQFVIDEMDIIDDNFGGISGFVPSEMGVAAAQLRPDLVYTILMGNPNMRDAVALFHANHANLTASAALSAATIKAAVSKMMLQRENSRSLNLAPSALIVPPSLYFTALELVRSTQVVGQGQSAAPAPSFNSISAMGLQVVTDPRLENGVADPTDGSGGTTNAGSATTWFLSASAAAGSHTIEVGYRRGTGRAPAVRTSVLTQGKWGLGWDVVHDIGAKALDWRGLAKQTA